MVHKALADHVLISSSFKEHVMRVTKETKGVNEACVVIRYLGSGNGKILRGDFQEVDVVEVLVRKERWWTYFRWTST